MKKYTVKIGKNSFVVEAINLVSAKSIAQVNKRHLKYKGKTEVKAIN